MLKRTTIELAGDGGVWSLLIKVACRAVNEYQGVGVRRWPIGYFSTENNTDEWKPWIRTKSCMREDFTLWMVICRSGVEVLRERCTRCVTVWFTEIVHRNDVYGEGSARVINLLVEFCERWKYRIKKICSLFAIVVLNSKSGFKRKKIKNHRGSCCLLSVTIGGYDMILSKNWKNFSRVIYIVKRRRSCDISILD